MAADVCAAAALAGDTRVVKLVKIHPIDYKALGALLDGAEALLLCEEGIRAGGVPRGIAAELAGGRRTASAPSRASSPTATRKHSSNCLASCPSSLPTTCGGWKHEAGRAAVPKGPL